MCLCHKRLKENPQTSARRAVLVTGRARAWCLKSRGLFCFAVISFEFWFRGRLKSNIKCELSTCVSLCAGCLFLQLPKVVRNINLNIPHIVFFFFFFCLCQLGRVLTESLKCSRWKPLASASSRHLSLLFIFIFFTLRDYIRYATLKSGDQIKRCSFGLGKYFLAMLCIWRKTTSFY